MKYEWIIFFVTGLLIIFLSYQIKYKKQAHFIAGYDEGLITDKDGFCNWIGGVLMVLGIYSLIASFLVWRWPEKNMSVILSFMVFVPLDLIVAINGGKKYKKKI